MFRLGPQATPRTAEMKARTDAAALDLSVLSRTKLPHAKNIDHRGRAGESRVQTRAAAYVDGDCER